MVLLFILNQGTGESEIGDFFVLFITIAYASTITSK